MSFLLKPKIFGYFGIQAKRNDTYKDINGKGISERYQECIGEDYDEETQDLLDNFIDRTIIPSQILPTMIPYMELMLGNPVVVSNAVLMRRRIIQFAQHIYNIKSTHLSYEVLFKMLGFDTVTVQEFVIQTGFDSDLTFDDEVRVFDNSGKCCSDYSVHLTGSITITQVVFDAVFRIIDFLEPINADLRQVTYNGLPIIVETGGLFDFTFDDSFE